MFGNARTAVKFFFYGLLIGVFFAPRSGEESRTQAIDWVMDTVRNVIGGRPS